MKKKVFSAAFLLLSLFFANSVFADFNGIPLTVSDTSGFARVSEPVSSGVPLPEDANITDPASLVLLNAVQEAVPVQIEVLARWRGPVADVSRPIKWVLLDFYADVPANGKSNYLLVAKDGGENQAPSTSLSIEQTPDYMDVNTGKAIFRISKEHFNLFDYVWVDGDKDGQLDEVIVSQPDQGGIVLIDQDGKKHTALLEPPEQIVVEQEGPLRAVVKVRGILKANDGSYYAPSARNPQASEFYADYPRFDQPAYDKSFVYYSARIHFFNEKNFVKVFFTFEQNGAQGYITPESYYAPRQVVYFKSLELELNTTINSPGVRSENASAQLGPSDHFSIFQGWRENMSNLPYTLEERFGEGLYFETRNGEQIIASGRKNPGWLEMSDANVSLRFAMRYFWQNFHKKLSVSNNKLIISLWPEEGYYPFNEERRNQQTYLLSGGRHKTHEILLGFGGQQEASESRALSNKHKQPLMALAPPQWYAKAKAFDFIVPADLISDNPTFNEAFQRYEQKQRSMVMDDQSDTGHTMTNIRTSTKVVNGGSDKKWKYWGWMNFGDYLWKMGVYGNGHGALPYSILQHYLRTGQREFFDAGAEMIRHRYDIDQYHGDRIDTQKGAHTAYNYFQRFEQTMHSDNSLPDDFISGEKFGEGDESSIPEYSWNHGLVFYYLLTGDKKALEAVEELAAGLENRFGANGEKVDAPVCTDSGLSTQINSILMLVNLYRLKGEARYLETALKIAKNVILYREQQLGELGRLGNGSGRGTTIAYLLAGVAECQESGCGNCSNVETVSGRLYNALIALHEESQDADIRELILRMADFVDQEVVFGNHYDDAGKYYPSQGVKYWLKEDPDGAVREQKGHTSNNISFADLLAYVYMLTADAHYLQKARILFKDTIFYSYDYMGYLSDTGIDPAYRKPIGYDKASTKEHAQIGRQGQAYLYAEWLNQQDTPAGCTEDSDADGVVDCNDQCPDDPGKIAPGVCGCSVADMDSDADGVMDCIDNRACLEADWSYTDGQCQVDSTLVRTWTLTGNCQGGVTHPGTEQVACEYDGSGSGNGDGSSSEDGSGSGDGSGGESGGGCFVFSIKR